MSRISPNKVARAFGIRIGTNYDMNDLIGTWRSIYQGSPSWVGDGNEQVRSSLGIAPAIVNDLAGKTVSELTLSNNTDALLEQFFTDEIQEQIRQQLEYGLALGSFICRPYYDGEMNRISLSWYTADRFIPVDWSGKRCVSGVFIDQDEVHIGNMTKYYTKLELQKWKYGTDGIGGSVSVRVKAFESNSPDDISREIPLASYKKWENIPPETEINNLPAPLFVYAGMPFANNKAMNSYAGCSIFKDGEAVIERIDRTWDNLNWELESSANKVFVDESALPTTRDSQGHLITKIDSRDKKLYRVLDANGSAGNLIDIYSPAIRQADITATLKTNISLLCSLMHLDAGAYVYDEAKQSVTAKEITSKEQKTYQTICDLHRWTVTPAILRIIEATRMLQYLYDLPHFTATDIAVGYGDSILTDEESEKQNAQTEVQFGLRSKLNYMMEYRNMTEDEARRELAVIDTEKPAQVDFFASGLEG